MSQERIEAAAKAHYQSSPHSETWEQADAETRQWFLGRIARGLAAADAVMFSDEAIERAVVAMWNHDFPSHPINDVSELLEWTRERRLEQARVVVAALKGDA